MPSARMTGVLGREAGAPEHGFGVWSTARESNPKPAYSVGAGSQAVLSTRVVAYLAM